MPANLCQREHCYHSGVVFRGRWACCRCTAPVVLPRDPEGREREEKTHGFIGCNAGEPHYPILSSIDRKIAKWLRDGGEADGGDLLDLLNIVEGLDRKLAADLTKQARVRIL